MTKIDGGSMPPEHLSIYEAKQADCKLNVTEKGDRLYNQLHNYSFHIFILF
jgi:hypothetical protein